MKYLPSQNVSDEFWANLRTNILELLKKEEILQLWYGGCLQHADGLRHVPLDCLDADGEPLLPDISQSYLSPKYSPCNVKLLSALGVRDLSISEFCKAVSWDLKAQSSRMKSAETSDDWHTRVAKKLLAIAESDLSLVQDLACIPLQDGSWKSAHGRRKYFPKCHNVPIPADLNLHLVRKEALVNATRKKLFYALGVKSCSPKTVTPLILPKYNTPNVDLQSSVSHLRWLFFFLPEQERDLDERIPVLASDGVPTYQEVIRGTESRVSDLYFETENNYGVKELCRERQFKGRKIYYEIHFINEAYLDAVDPAARVNDLSWLRWLQTHAGVRRTPRLVKTSDSSKLSALFSWLVSDRPEQILGTLHANWRSYKNQMVPEIVNILRKAKVLCEGTKWISLEATWMPTCELLDLCQDFDLVEEMPLLKLPLDLDPANQEDWAFLKGFGVGFEPTTRFFLEMLRVLKDSEVVDPALLFQDVLKVYRMIEMNSNTSDYDEIR